MKVKEKLINEVKNRIAEIENQINEQELNEIQDLKKAASTLEKKILSIKNSPSQKISKDSKIKRDDITGLNIDTIKKIFPDINREHIDSLNNYNKMWGKIFFNPNKDAVLNNLNLICESLLELIDSKEKLFLTLEQQKNLLQKILNTLENNYINISKTDLDSIVEILKVFGKTEIEILEYLRELAIDIEKSILSSKEETSEKSEKNINSYKEDEEEILEENSDDIQLGIIRILKENDYNDIVSYFEREEDSIEIKKIKEKLYKYGNIDKIEQIVKTLRKYNINLLEQMESNFLKILKIFFASSKENLETIFNMALEPEICICKYDESGNLLLDEHGNPQVNFTLLLERPSRFISKKIGYKRRGNNTQYIEIDNDIVGNMNDYIKNVRYYQNVLGVDFKKIFCSTRPVKKNNDLTAPPKKDSAGEKKYSRNKAYGYLDVPHEKVLRNQAVFDFYQIPLESRASALSCFTATNPEDTIDMFIELDIFDYLKNKMSCVTKKPDNPEFYRIARTYQLSESLPNPQHLPLHENAKKFIFSQWKDDGTPAGTKTYINKPHVINFDDEKTIQVGNPNSYNSNILKIQLNTGINSRNGSVITGQYRRKEVLSEVELYNFDCFDEVVKNSDNTSADLIDEGSLLIRRINTMSNIMSKYNKANSNVLIFGREPNEFRISKMKFFRIYNTLIKEGFNIENDRDCVLYALTYNSILTKEQFELVKLIVNETLFKNIPKTNGKVGRRQ